MKFTTDTVQETQSFAATQCVEFPSGIVGFPNFKKAEILYQADQLPFMWLKGVGEEKIAFLVLEPGSLIPNYEIELTDADVTFLDLKNPSEAMVLIVATIQGGKAKKILVNLVGPMVINRRTLKAKQVIIGNCQKYSARHVLYQEEA